MTTLIILTVCAFTAFLSGIFGMAGGMILIGVLLAIPELSLPQTMIIHGGIQMLANGTRVILLWEYVQWHSLVSYGAGALFTVFVLLLISVELEKKHVYLALSLVPLLLLIPKRRFALDIRRRPHAILAGLLSQGMNTIIGVTGPLMDIFFANTNMKRQEIVGTKSAIQTYSHLVKIAFWTIPVLQSNTMNARFPALWLFALALPITVFATRLGRQVLERMNDNNFYVWQRSLVFIIGFVFLYRAWISW